MWFLGVIASVLGLFLSRASDVTDLATGIFGSFVAVTGDAHQAKVAQDIFRQQVRYERSLQIREDMRDVNKLMMESVQTHVIMGSIILGVCFTMGIEGTPPSEADRAVTAMWLVFTAWSATFTLIALWLALRFQMKISSSARERLLRRHRFLVPDDSVVGRMGGHNVVNQVAYFHNWMLSTFKQMWPEATDETLIGKQVFPARSEATLRVPVESCFGQKLDVEPFTKGMHAWIHPSGIGYSTHTTLDVPFFLVGETLVKSKWEFRGDKKLMLRVYGESTLYVGAQCPPLGGSMNAVNGQPTRASLRKAVWLDGQVPAWPVEELPVCLSGFHEDWAGEDGFGEFRHVEGFSIHVSADEMEIPLYKLVLSSPAEGEKYVDVVLRWTFKIGCDALILVVRKGHVHCKEEDWPLAEFNLEIKEVMLLRHYSGMFLRYGVSCLLVAALLMFAGRFWLFMDLPLWWFEVLLTFIAIMPAVLVVRYVKIDIQDTETALSMYEINKSANIPMRENMTEDKPDERQRNRLVAGGAEDKEQKISTHTTATQVEASSVPEANPATGTSGQNHTDAGHPALARMLAPPPSPRGLDSTRDGGCASRQPAAHDSTSETRGVSPLTTLGCCSSLELKDKREILSTCTPAFASRLSPAPPNSPQGQLAPQAFPRSIWTHPAGGAAAGQSPEPSQPSAAQVQLQLQGNASGACHSPPKVPSPRERRRISWDEVTWDEPRREISDRFRRGNSQLSNKSQKSLSRVRSMLRVRMQTLSFWTHAIYVLFSGSLISVILLRFTWFVSEEVHHPDLVPTGLPWTIWDMSWPPFFQPTAALLDVGSGALHVAAGAVSRRFELSAGLRAWKPVGHAWLLPRVAKGLGLISGQLVAASDAGVHTINQSATGTTNFSWRSNMSQGQLELVDSAVHAFSLLLHRLPPSLGSLASAAVVEIPSGSGMMSAFIIAIRQGGVFLCRSGAGRPPGSPSNESYLEVVTELEPVGKRLQDVRALHICKAGTCAGEPVLWAALPDNLIAAIGLSSGQVLATFAVAMASVLQVGLRGSTDTEGGLVALTGNASHLIAVFAAGMQAPIMASVTYPVLPTARSGHEL